MKTLHKRRLLKLGRFLRDDERVKGHFDMRRFYCNFFRFYCNLFDWRAFYKPTGCHTTACAIGWCPAVFPSLWKWDSSEGFQLRGDSATNEFYLARVFFGVTSHEVSALFGCRGYERANLDPELVGNYLIKFAMTRELPDR